MGLRQQDSARALAMGGRVTRVGVQKDRKRQARRDAHHAAKGIGAPASSAVRKSRGRGRVGPCCAVGSHPMTRSGHASPRWWGWGGRRGSDQRREPLRRGTWRSGEPDNIGNHHTMKPSLPAEVSWFVSGEEERVRYTM
jgi:hypothetical protein